MPQNNELDNDEEIAEFFDHCFDEGLFHKFEREELDSLIELLDIFRIKKGEWIVEPGCGCGRMTKILAEEVGSEGRIDACELSPKMADFCQRLNLPSWVRIHQKSILDLDLPRDSIDHVICFNVWPHLFPPEIFFEYFLKMLKPKGLLHIAHSRGRDFINSIHQGCEKEIIQKHQLQPAKEIAQLMEKSGWRVMEYKDRTNLYYLKAQKSEEDQNS